MTRRMRVFKRWMKANGIVYSDGLELVDSPSNGISVRSLRHLHEGEAVATIPKRACLTIKNSAARRMILRSGLDGHLGLSLAIMYERSLGISSPWFGYLQILPEMECSPLIWTSEEVDALLLGTELHKVIAISVFRLWIFRFLIRPWILISRQIVKEDKKLVHEDWREFIQPLVEAGEWGLDPSAFGVDQYFSAKTLVASRSFAIDEYHGYGMVPFADLFNHKTGLENVHFTAASSSSSSSDNEISEGAQEEAEEQDDDDDDDDDDDRESEDDQNEEDDDNAGDDDGTMEMIVVRDVEAGDEVFNTYGSMGNAALLLRYGFTEIDNPFDIVNLDLSLVLQWCSISFSSRHIRSRLWLWRRLRFSGCKSQNSEYFEISADGEPQIELLILLFIIFLPGEEYEKMNRDGEKRSGDDSMAMFLTEEVCRGLLGIADARETLYGAGSMEEDMEMLSRCRREEDRKLHDSLVLRLAERRVLSRFRVYIAGRRPAAKRKAGLHYQNNRRLRIHS